MYIPRVQQALDEFVAQWNTHPFSTESSLIPEQLLIEGAFCSAQIQMVAYDRRQHQNAGN